MCSMFSRLAVYMIKSCTVFSWLFSESDTSEVNILVLGLTPLGLDDTSSANPYRTGAGAGRMRS